MALTILMFFVLIVSFALMIGLVRFTENVIAAPEAVAAGNDASAGGVDMKSAP